MGSTDEVLDHFDHDFSGFFKVVRIESKNVKKWGKKREKSVAPRLLGAGRAIGYPDVAKFSCGSARARFYSLRHLLPLAIIK